MALNDIYLGLAGSEILLTPIDRKYSESKVPIERAQRTASGRLVKDITAVKIKFNISYATLKDADLIQLSNIYSLETELNLKVTKPQGVVSYTVHMGPFDQSRIKAIHGGLWGDVSFDLEQA